MKRKFYSYWITGAGKEGCEGDASAIFPYWSFTKTVIAICALKLHEQGIVDLDAFVLGQAFSSRQLLNHTSGLPDYSQLPEYHRAVSAGEESWSRDKMLERALAKGMLFKPGEGWSYSNIGYMSAQEYLSELTGKSLRQLIDEIVIAPLGIKTVKLALTREQFAKVYWKEAGNYDPRWVYHGCLIGTAGDAVRILHALFAGQLLKAETLAKMQVRIPLGGALDGRPWTDHGYALGLMSGEFGTGNRAIGHSGGGPFSVNAVYHFPDGEELITVASFTNGTDEGLAEQRAVEIHSMSHSQFRYT